MSNDKNDSHITDYRRTGTERMRRYKDEKEKKVSCNISVRASTIDDFKQTCAFNGVDHSTELENIMEGYVKKNGYEVSIPKMEKKIAEETALLSEMRQKKAESGSISDKIIIEYLKKEFEKKPFLIVKDGDIERKVYSEQPITYKAFCGILNNAGDKFKRPYEDIMSLADKAIIDVPDETLRNNIAAHLEERMQRLMSPQPQAQPGTIPEPATKTPTTPLDEE